MTIILSFFLLLIISTTRVSGQTPLVFNIDTTTCPSSCQPPNCYCPRNSIPGGLDINDTPQFVFITLDDSLYQNDFTCMANFTWILNNPDIRDSLGCTLKASWYTMEQWTDYNVVNYVSKIGAINIHTYTHTTSDTTTATTWMNEENTLLDDYTVLARVPRQWIRGSRAPFLQTNDAYFTRLQTLGIQFDSSMINDITEVTYWPFTLDYGVPDTILCNNDYGTGCPTESKPGLWEVPMTNIFPLDNSFMDPTWPTWGYTTYLNTLKANFLCDYNGTCEGATNPNHTPMRTPKGFYWHWRYMSSDHVFSENVVGYPNINPPPLHTQNIQLFTDFYTWVASLPNVIFATETMVIEWMKNPVNYQTTAQMPLFTTCPPLGLNPSVTCPTTVCPYAAQNTGKVIVCGTDCPNVNPGIETTGTRVWTLPDGIPDYSSTTTFLSTCFDNQYPTASNWPGIVNINCYEPVGCVLVPYSYFCAHITLTNPDPVRTAVAAFVTILGCKVEVSQLGQMWSEEPYSTWGYASQWFTSGSTITGLNMLGTSLSIPPLTTVTFGGFCMLSNNDGLTQFSMPDGVFWGVDLYESPVSCSVSTCVAVCGNRNCEEGETASNCPVDCLEWTCPATRRFLSSIGHI